MNLRDLRFCNAGISLGCGVALLVLGLCELPRMIPLAVSLLGLGCIGIGLAHLTEEREGSP